MTPSVLRELLDTVFPADGIPFTVDSERIIRSGRRIRRRRRAVGAVAGAVVVLAAVLAVPVVHDATESSAVGDGPTPVAPQHGSTTDGTDEGISWDDSDDWDSTGFTPSQDESTVAATAAISTAITAVDPDIVELFDDNMFKYYRQTARDDSAVRDTVRRTGWISRPGERYATRLDLSVFNADVVTDLVPAVDCRRWARCVVAELADDTIAVLVSGHRSDRGLMNRVYAQRPGGGDILVFSAQVDLTMTVAPDGTDPRTSRPPLHTGTAVALPILGTEDLVELVLAMPPDLAP